MSCDLALDYKKKCTANLALQLQTDRDIPGNLAISDQAFGCHHTVYIRDLESLTVMAIDCGNILPVEMFLLLVH